MAAEPTTDHSRGHMDISEQTSTFENVFDKGLLRMGSLAVACLILFLTIAFCTAAGWFTALIVTGIVALIGAVVLRKAPTSAETH